MGSVVSHEFGPRNNLPPYVCVPSQPTNFAGSGYLSSAFAPFSLGADPANGNFNVQDLTLPGGVDDKRFTARRTMLDAVNDHFDSKEKADGLEAMDTFYQRAYSLISSDKAREAFNINAEAPALRDEYGRNAAGQRMLMAKRLVAAGVRFVSLTYGGWDMHTGIKDGMRGQLPVFDQAFATLIRDLDRSGLLDSTLVMVSSEFGRTPKINANAGRDHWPKVFSVVLAGGGIKKGFIYGKSDSTATEPEEDALYGRGPGDDGLQTDRHRRHEEAHGAGRPADRPRPQRPGPQGTDRVRETIHHRDTENTERRQQREEGPIMRLYLWNTKILSVRFLSVFSVPLWCNLLLLRRRVGGIAPRGAQRGTDAVFLFNGARLSDAQELLFYSPGLSTVKLEVVNDGQVKATVKIAPDCRLGEHAVRLRTATGVSELRTFYVGALPVVDEKEPNSDFAAPQKIPLNVTVQGVVDNEDVDYFAVECKKGQRLSAEIEGMRLGGTLFDPYIAILDSKRFELAACDDTPMLGQDAACSIIVPADGTYVIQVRESAYGGNGGCHYRLHVGTFPRPMAVVPAGGKCGEEVEVTFLGDPAGPFKQKIKLPATPDAKFGLFAQDAGGVSPSPVPFRLSEFGNVVEADGNDHAADGHARARSCRPRSTA